jgi:hypothetical protein
MAERLGMGSQAALPPFVSAGRWDCAPLRAGLPAQAERLAGGADGCLIVDGEPEKQRIR